MKIPQHIIDKAEKINNYAVKGREAERELIQWIESKGFTAEDFGESDIIAELSYGNYNDINDFIEQLSRAMESNEW